PRPPGTGRRMALPVGVVGVVVACLLAWRAALRTGVFDDTFWHRAAGEWMLRHHRVITHDVFSYTVHGRSWISPEWGYDVALAQSLRTFGAGALWFFSAGLATLAVLAVVVRCRLVGAGWLWTGLLAIEAGAAITLFLDDRPQMVSYLFLALLLLTLTLARRSTRWLWAVPVLFVLWANLHGSFLLGLGVLALEVVSSLVGPARGRLWSEPLRRRPAVASLGSAALATLVNPFGPAVYRSALGVTFNPAVRQLVSEWQSPDFHDPTILAVVVFPVVVTVAYCALSDGRVPALELVLAGFLFVSLLDAVRFVPYFAVAWCAMAARTAPLKSETLRPTLLVWPVLVLLGVGFLAGPVVPPGTPAAANPVAAVTFLSQHRGRIFSTYLWNDYLDGAGRQVFVDGRTELYTDDGVLSTYLAVADLGEDPDPVLRRYHVAYVLWPTDGALARYLGRDPGWRLVWHSSSAEVFRAVA
ncbi:MAG TPA: hypothetical protein VMB72_02155, partial [Acidimicrobiales bacterium]|nr:hypothetical protein [Acidimicrobiales bacterium]